MKTEVVIRPTAADSEEECSDRKNSDFVSFSQECNDCAGAKLNLKLSDEAANRFSDGLRGNVFKWHRPRPQGYPHLRDRDTSVESRPKNGLLQPCR